MIFGQDQLLKGQNRKPGAIGILLLAPMALWLVLFVAAPTALMVLYSFASRDELGEIVYSFNFDNYRRMFHGLDAKIMFHASLAIAAGGLAAWIAQLVRHRLFPHRTRAPRIVTGAAIALCIFLHFYLEATTPRPLYVIILWRSVELAGITALLCLLLGYPAAYFIARSDERWRNRLILLVMLPFWTSFLIRTYAWISIFKQQGLLNAFLESVGIVPRLMSPTSLMYTPTAVVVGMVYTFLPFMILPLYGSIEQLDGSLLQAAMNLGARPARTFVEIILPLTMPGIAAGFLLVFVPAIGMFAVTDLLGGAKVPMIGNVIQNQFGQARNAPFGAALGISLLALFIAVFALLSLRPRETS